jgi:hypothetical protein
MWLFSRSPGRDSIRILRTFNRVISELLMTHVSQELRDEDRRLSVQALETFRRFKDGTLFDSNYPPIPYDTTTIL